MLNGDKNITRIHDAKMDSHKSFVANIIIWVTTGLAIYAAAYEWPMATLGDPISRLKSFVLVNWYDAHLAYGYQYFGIQTEAVHGTNSHDYDLEILNMFVSTFFQPLGVYEFVCIKTSSHAYVHLQHVCRSVIFLRSSDFALNFTFENDIEK